MVTARPFGIVTELLKSAALVKQPTGWLCPVHLLPPDADAATQLALGAHPDDA
jgi:hypothetical protein